MREYNEALAEYLKWHLINIEKDVDELSTGKRPDTEEHKYIPVNSVRAESYAKHCLMQVIAMQKGYKDMLLDVMKNAINPVMVMPEELQQKLLEKQINVRPGALNFVNEPKPEEKELTLLEKFFKLFRWCK